MITLDKAHSNKIKSTLIQFKSFLDGRSLKLRHVDFNSFLEVRDLCNKFIGVSNKIDEISSTQNLVQRIMHYCNELKSSVTVDNLDLLYALCKVGCDTYLIRDSIDYAIDTYLKKYEELLELNKSNYTSKIDYAFKNIKLICSQAYFSPTINFNENINVLLDLLLDKEDFDNKEKIAIKLNIILFFMKQTPSVFDVLISFLKYDEMDLVVYDKLLLYDTLKFCKQFNSNFGNIDSGLTEPNEYKINLDIIKNNI